jgi:hypothetical protein
MYSTEFYADHRFRELLGQRLAGQPMLPEVHDIHHLAEVP